MLHQVRGSRVRAVSFAALVWLLIFVFAQSAMASIAPARPKNVKAVSASHTAIKISWEKAIGATHYKVFRASSKAGVYKAVGSSYLKSNSLVNGSLVTGTPYYYKVKAYTLSGGKYYASGSSGIVMAKPVLSRPAGVKAVSTGYNSIKISWTKVPGATHYRVFRSASKTGPFTALGTSRTKYSSLANTVGLTTGKSYYYKVVAYKLIGSKYVPSAFSVAAVACCTNGNRNHRGDKLSAC